MSMLSYYYFLQLDYGFPEESSVCIFLSCCSWTIVELPGVLSLNFILLMHHSFLVAEWSTLYSLSLQDYTKGHKVSIIHISFRIIV